MDQAVRAKARRRIGGQPSAALGTFSRKVAHSIPAFGTADCADYADQRKELRSAQMSRPSQLEGHYWTAPSRRSMPIGVYLRLTTLRNSQACSTPISGIGGRK